jgi:hypothetical protein
MDHSLLSSRSPNPSADRSSQRVYLDRWLKDAGSSGLRPFVSLAHGIQSDNAAVINGLKLL